jgi:deoxyribonuclease V
MQLEYRHPLHVSMGEAREWQEKLRGRVSESRGLNPGGIKRIAGTDISYLREYRLALGAVVLMEFPGLQVLEERRSVVEVDFPYVPGLLSFRELPALIPALEALSGEPDLIFVDGQGIAHPRGFGLASHLGVLTGKPTLGCAKSRLVGEYREPGPRVGDWEPLIYDEKQVGAVLRTRSKVKPLFISVGHCIDLDTAVEMVLACSTGFRLPEPQRKAHRMADEAKRAVKAGETGT